MKEKQNETSKSFITPLFLVLHLFAFILLFLFLTPKISSRIFPFVSSNELSEFIEQSESSKNIDAQKYWEFREFFSPGSFQFSKTGISQRTTNRIVKRAGVFLKDDFDIMPFLVFNSPKLVSVDFLTTHTTLDQIIDLDEIKNKKILLQTENELIYENDPSQIIIIFLKSPSDMKRANGFFDYRIEDKELTENKYWLNITIITQQK